MSEPEYSRMQDMASMISGGLHTAQGQHWDLAPYTRAALYLFATAVPLTHSAGLVAHAPRAVAARAVHLLLYPFVGGRLHAIFHTLAWVVWGLSLLIAAPVLLSPRLIPDSHVEALLGAAAVGAVFAELFMIKGLLIFDPEEGDRAHGRDSQTGQLAVPRWNLALLPRKEVASGLVTAMGLLWAVMGGALLYLIPYLSNVHSKMTYYILAALCLLIGASTTHGLAGPLRHKATVGWRFWQPFEGGIAFVATQAAGWALTAASLASMLWIGRQIALGVAHAIWHWLLATSAVMLLAQVLLGVSILTFRGRAIADVVVEAVSPMLRSSSSAKQLPGFPEPSLATIWLPILMLYMPVHTLTSAIVITYMLLPAPIATAAWIGGLAIYYGATTFNRPEHSGCRRWEGFRNWVTANIDESLAAWFGRVELVRDGQTDFDPKQRYMFGYSPHGLFPIGVGYLPLMPAWRLALPGIDPIQLTASVVFHMPVIRDLVSWAGFRQVARKTFVAALQERGSVLFVPGGQAELVHTHRASAKNREWVAYTGHKGFVRLAIEQQAALVPIVVLGEIDCLRNFVDAPRLQAWSYKKLGFPVPYLVVGRWGVSPLPRQTGLKFVIGEPLAPPPHVAGEQVKQATVDKLHETYYGEVARLFQKHKEGFPGYDDVRLAFASN